MTTATLTYPREPFVGKWWWVLLVMGILWIILGVYVLQAHYGSAVAIAYLVVCGSSSRGSRSSYTSGSLQAGSGFMPSSACSSSSVASRRSLSPFQTFMVLASLIGLFLILKGTFDFVLAIALRHEIDLWWLTLIAGIIQSRSGASGRWVIRAARRLCCSSGLVSAPSSVASERSSWRSTCARSRREHLA